MSIVGAPSVFQRSPGLIDLAVRNIPGTERWRFRVAVSLDDAYVGAAGSPLNGVTGSGAGVRNTAIFEVRQGDHMRSRTIRQKRWGVLDECSREFTRAIFDMDDYFAPAATPPLPSDRDFIYLRLQQWRTAAAAWAPEGPIFIIPTVRFKNISTGNPTLNLHGTAPNIATALPGFPPPAGSLNFFLPGTGGSFELWNQHSSQSLLLSFGPNAPMRDIAAGQYASIQGGGAEDEIFIVATANNPTFAMSIVDRTSNLT